MSKKGSKPDISKRKLDELQKALKEYPFEKIAKVKNKYTEVRNKFEQFQKERSARLSRVSTERLQTIMKSELLRKAEPKENPCGAQSKGNPSSLEVPPSIFPIDPCASDFDATELSLRSNRGVFTRNFYKILIFNHPFKPGFIRNGWYVGQLLRFRQEWRPAGFTIGELIQSFSLLPLEKTTIEMSSWEKTRKEIEQMEESTEKNELMAQSRTTDSSQISKTTSEKFAWHVDAKANANWGWGSASLEAGLSGSTEKQASSMVSSVSDQTRSSANSLSQSRSVKVSLSQEAGSEQRIVRTLENTNRCHTLSFNFFQLNKRYDLVMTYLDSPLCLIFPNWRATSANPTIQSMVARLNEGLRDVTSIYNIITHYMGPNRDATEFLNKASSDPIAPAPFGEGVIYLEFTTFDPDEIKEGLLYFFGMVWNAPADISPADLATWDDMLAKYMEMESAIRLREIEMGDTIIDSVEILTPAVYVDSMIGKCSGCEDYITLSRSNEALKDFQTARELALKNDLLEKEKARRQALLDKGVLDPFEPPPPPPKSEADTG